jgi:type II secretory pathway component PulK
VVVIVVVVVVVFVVVVVGLLGSQHNNMESITTTQHQALRLNTYRGRCLLSKSYLTR